MDYASDCLRGVFPLASRKIIKIFAELQNDECESPARIPHPSFYVCRYWRSRSKFCGVIFA